MSTEIRMRFLHAAIGVSVVFSLAAFAAAQTGSEAPASPSAALPKDVDPHSFSRLPVVKRDDLDQDGKRIYDMLAGGEGKTVTPTGPAAISLYSPKVAEAIQMLNQYLRFHGVLKPRDYRGSDSGGGAGVRSAVRMERARNGRAQVAKVPQPVIDAIKYNKDTAGLSDRDTLIITFARDSFQQHRISSGSVCQNS